MTLLPDSDDPDRFRPGAEFLTDSGMALVVATVARYRDQGLLVGFEGVHDRAAAERLRGEVLTITPGERRALPAGEYWIDDLVGLAAVDSGGDLLGTVSAVEKGVGQDRLIVTTPAGDEVLVPFVDEIVDDPAGGRVVLHPPPGLFDRPAGGERSGDP